MRFRGNTLVASVAGAAAIVGAAAAAIVGVQALVARPAGAATVPPGGVVTVSNITPFNAANKTIQAVCPAGRKVIGGGGEISGSSHVVLTELRPVTGTGADRYQVSAVVDKTGQAGLWALLAYAFCGPPPAGLQIVTATSATSSAFFTGISASCPAGKFVVGSGGRINGGAGQVDLLTLGEGGSFPNRTTAAGQTLGFAGTWSVTAYAICVKPADLFDLQMVKTFSPLDSTPNKAATATCPIGKRATGGAGWADVPAHVTVIRPNGFRLGVTVAAQNPGATTGQWQLIAVAFCAS